MKKALASILLAAAFSIPTFAGDIGTGPVVNPTPQPTASQTAEEGDIGTGPLAAIVNLLLATFDALS